MRRVSVIAVTLRRLGTVEDVRVSAPWIGVPVLEQELVLDLTQFCTLDGFVPSEVQSTDVPQAAPLQDAPGTHVDGHRLSPHSCRPQSREGDGDQG
jgi:hypothetical protein